MKKRYTHLLSHANTTCSFILTYKHDIHVLIYSTMQTQYTHSIQQFMLSQNINTHYYPAIRVEPDHQAPTTIQLLVLSWHTFTIFLIRSSYVLYVSNRLTQLRALLTVVILMCWHTFTHCRQRAPVENVSSTSGMLQSGILKEDRDDYPKFWLIYCIYNVLNYDVLWLVMYYRHFLSKYHCFFAVKKLYYF